MQNSRELEKERSKNDKTAPVHQKKPMTQAEKSSEEKQKNRPRTTK